MLSESELSPGREVGMPNEYSTARIAWTKFFSTRMVFHLVVGRDRECRMRETYIRLAQGFEQHS